jgi:ATPase subunit of ABC transporter with duplicated ATPase domains
MVSPNSGTTASTTSATATAATATTTTATSATATAATNTNTITNTDTKVPDVYILMGPIGTGKSTALKCIKEKLNPLNVMVASGEYKSKYFYPIIPNMGFGNNNSIAATINGITPLQIGAYIIH